ncbi:unnamed protein product [Oikopleura dioica]|uniref:Tetraspanin n=1 Tax=Oikopleura dioica TaxID=34765 RepID=E4YD92_OIKDI|nr:unnamed protein product [Oikopleura dioica]
MTSSDLFQTGFYGNSDITFDTPTFFDAVDYNGIHSLCITIGSSLLLVGFISFTLIALRCLSGEYLIFLIIWTCMMIVAELMYFTFIQRTWVQVKPWLLSMYVGYSERTPLNYKADGLNNGAKFNMTTIARSKFVDRFHEEFQCCGWSSRFDIPNRYFWSAKHCQINFDRHGVRYLPT